MSSIFGIKNTKLNKLLLLEDSLSIFLFLSGLLYFNNKVLYLLGIIDLSFLYIVFFIKLIRRKDLTIVEIFLTFLYLYVIGTYIFYNNAKFINLILKSFVNSVPHPNKYELLLMNSILFVFTKILSLPVFDIKIKLKPYRQKLYSYKSYGKFALFPYIIMPIFILYLLFLVRTFSNYDEFNESGGIYFSLIVYFSFVTSILVVITDQEVPWNKRLLKTLLALLCIALVAKVGSRTYAVYILFSLLINLKKRGLKLGNRLVIIFLTVGLFGILYQSLARFGISGLENAFSLLTLFGEFFLPAYSFYYYTNNPLNYVYYFGWTDFFVKLFPTKILPLLRIDAFMKYYSIHGIAIAPVGGLFLYGQLIYYFGIFSIIPVFLLAVYLSYYKNNVEQKGNLKISLILPISFLILPRQLLYLLPKCVLTIFFFYLLMNFLLNKPCLKK